MGLRKDDVQIFLVPSYTSQSVWEYACGSLLSCCESTAAYRAQYVSLGAVGRSGQVSFSLRISHSRKRGLTEYPKDGFGTG